jgi:GT2 family glycosyltransferase
MMSAPLLVSVCIANYNGMDVIDDCIRSVQAQLGDIAVEILVHDDVSTDASVSHIQEHYPQAKLIISESNVGFCIANNRMAALAQGQYLLLLNNDAALYPDALQELLAEANNIGKPAILTLPQYDATTGVMVDRGCLLDPFFNPVPNLDPKRTDVAMVIGACLWVPKTLWEELEGFPEWFGSIAEDMYLCCRARLSGYAVRALSVSGYRHWQGRSFGGGKVVGDRLRTTFRRRALSERNKTFVMLATCPTLWLLMLLPVHLTILVLEGLALVCAKRSVSVGREIYLACLLSLWQFRHQVCVLRRAVQARSRVNPLNFAAVFQVMPYKLQMLMRHGLPDVQR